RKEGFQDIRKVEKIADLEAKKDGIKFAVQVTQTNNKLSDIISKLNRSAKEDEKRRTGSTFGKTLSEIKDELEEPLSSLFWNAIDQKNTKFKKWSKVGYQRCIALITNDERLVDYPLESCIACQQIGQIIQ